MRLDYQSAISDLKRALELLGADPTSEGDFSARLYDFTSSLFEHPLCAQALETVLQARSRPGDILQQNCTMIANEVADSFLSICKSILDLDDRLTTSPPKASGDHDALKQARKDLDQPWTLGGDRKPIRSWFPEISNASRLATLGFDALQELPRVLDQLSAVHRTLSRAAGTPMQRDPEAVENLRQLLSDRVRVLSFTEQLLRASNLRPIVDDFRAIHSTLSGLLDGTGFPAGAAAMMQRFRSEGGFDKARANASRVARFVESRLHLGTVQRHSVHRLRSFLETFGKPLLLQAFDDEERIHPTNRRFEDRLQEHADRFLFTEGLFPFTHSQASGGAIDSFLTQNEALFRDVIATHQIPLLLELKVHVRNDTTATDVRNKINEALEQLEIYSTQFRSSATWQHHELTAFVVYDGPKRFTTPQQGVVLCYLGGASPSAGSTSLG